MTKLTYTELAAELWGIPLHEAEEEPTKFASKAAEDANRLGLTHTGFGLYANAEGDIVARSVVDPSSGETVLVRIVREPTKPTNAPDLPDEPAAEPSKISKTTGVVSKMQEFVSDPAQFSKFVRRIIELESSRPQLYGAGATFAITNAKTGTKTKFFSVKVPEKSSVNVGAYLPPSLVTTIQGGKTPTHIVIRDKAYPLSNGTRGSNEFYDLTGLAKAEGIAYMDDLEKAAKNKTASATAATRATTPTITPDKNIELHNAMIQSARNKMDNRMTAYEAALKGEGSTGENIGMARIANATPQKFEILKTIRKDLDSFLQFPTKDRAIEIATKYGLTVNTGGNPVLSFKVLDALNGPPAASLTAKGTRFNPEKLGAFFSGHTDVGGSYSMRELMYDSFREALGVEFSDYVKSSVNLKTLTNPSVLFASRTRIPLQVKDVQRENAKIVSVDGMEFPEFFDSAISDKQIVQQINEYNILEESIQARAMKDPNYPPGSNPKNRALKLDELGKTISDSVLMYQDKLRMLHDISRNEEWIKMKGRDDLPKMVQELRTGIESAMNSLNLGISEMDRQALDQLALFANIDTSKSDEELDQEFAEQWNTFSNYIRREKDTELFQSLSSVCESLTVIMALRKNKTAYIPMNSSFGVIDALVLSDMSDFSANTIDDLINSDTNVQAIVTTIEMSSVKFGGTKADNRGEGSGNPPAISSLLNYYRFDESINPEYLNFFTNVNTTNSGDETYDYVAATMRDRMLADPALAPMLYDYFEVPPLTPSEQAKSPFLRTKRLQKAMEASVGPSAAGLETKAHLGKIGECLMNYAATRRLCDNYKYTNTEIKHTDAKVSQLGVRFQLTSNKSKASYKYELLDNVTPDNMRKASTIFIPKRAKEKA